jgi:hypothetical protein
MNRRVLDFAAPVLFLFAFCAACRADKRVLVFGIDGAGGSYTRTADTPHLDALAAQGAVRYDWLNEAALIPNPPERFGGSGVNWASASTGASAASHGVVDNSFVENNFERIPHWFKYVKEHDPTHFTASIVNWGPINEHIVPDAYTDLEIEFNDQERDIEDGLVRDEVVKLLSSGDPDAIFVHFDQVDAAGHGFSWGSPEYFASIQTVDGLIGDIMAALNGRSGVRDGGEDWLVMVAADHGGEQGSFVHVASQGPINWEVPFIISGASVPDGAALERGTLRDIAPTALWHLGIDPLPTTMEGHVVGILNVPEPDTLWLTCVAHIAALVVTRYQVNNKRPLIGSRS